MSRKADFYKNGGVRWFDQRHKLHGGFFGDISIGLINLGRASETKIAPAMVSIPLNSTNTFNFTLSLDIDKFKEMSAEERAGVLWHELMHIWSDHLGYNVRKETHMPNTTIRTIAQEIVCNDIVLAHDVDLPYKHDDSLDGIYYGDKWLGYNTYDKGMNTEDVYKALIEKAEEATQEMGEDNSDPDNDESQDDSTNEEGSSTSEVIDEDNSDSDSFGDSDSDSDDESDGESKSDSDSDSDSDTSSESGSNSLNGSSDDSNSDTSSESGSDSNSESGSDSNSESGSESDSGSGGDSSSDSVEDSDSESGSDSDSDSSGDASTRSDSGGMSEDEVEQGVKDILADALKNPEGKAHGALDHVEIDPNVDIDPDELEELIEKVTSGMKDPNALTNEDTDYDSGGVQKGSSMGDSLLGELAQDNSQESLNFVELLRKINPHIDERLGGQVGLSLYRNDWHMQPKYTYGMPRSTTPILPRMVPDELPTRGTDASTALVIAVDCSGSIPPEVRDWARNVITKIPQDLIDTRLVYFATNTQEVDITTNEFIGKNDMGRNGIGGGTEFGSITNWINQNYRQESTSVIVITDGLSDFYYYSSGIDDVAPRFPYDWYWVNIHKRGSISSDSFFNFSVSQKDFEDLVISVLRDSINQDLDKDHYIENNVLNISDILI